MPGAQRLLAALGLLLVLGLASAAGQEATGAPRQANLPPRVVQAQRFLAQRSGWTAGQGTQTARPAARRFNWRSSAVRPQSSTAASATWQAMGPAAVLTPDYGLVTGRVSALALDPSDATGNRLYVGTTGGGVWVAQNAATGSASNVVFSPLTDTVGPLTGTTDASISIGALTVQPGGTGVILAGTGDPNDALDSYYGAGILRSTDNGNTWSLISTSTDQKWSFDGEGFAGFAWSTTSPQLVVAAVSQAFEGTLVDAPRYGVSYVGLYYSSDGGATWSLATISDASGADVQGPNDPYAGADSNAATSVVWNPVRHLFVAAVRFHGYYQSADGVAWTRLAAQPGSGLSTLFCPTNAGSSGSTACPIFRGALAVNPQTGDTFAWTVDRFNQDQGLWQDKCGLSAGVCTNQNITFAQRLSTAALETSTGNGAATIANGDYNLTLAAVPSQQDTLLLAGANDLWKCSLAMGCAWRNTTNSTTCMSAQVGEYQHALAWNANNPMEMFVGNDSGLWRSLDAIGETGSACASTDGTHFQNLNGGLGSLAEVVSMAPSAATPYTMMLGLGANGIAGVKSGTGLTTDWPQILGGEGGPVVIDPINSANWYVNNGTGVSIHACSQSGACTPSAFGSSAVVTDADVSGDGLTMTTPAPFLVDALDHLQLLVGTCRVWRGPADGMGWSASNAVSNILDSAAASGACSGDALIRSMAAMALPSGGEVVYVGMYGRASGNTKMPGHVLSATVNYAGSSSPVWQDLTLNPVGNDTLAMNYFGMGISSIVIDTHDITGKTVYVTLEGVPSVDENIRTVYRSTDGGLHWTNLESNLPWSATNSLVVDPQDANTIYIGTDLGVYFTTRIANCANASADCWSALGSGLPQAPVTQLSASPLTSAAKVLMAGTYGRGVWQTPLWSAETGLTTAVATPAPLAFTSLVPVNTGSSLALTLMNTGTLDLLPTGTAVSGNFSVQTDNCKNTTVASGASCIIAVTFAPLKAIPLTGELTIYANVYGGQLTVELSGTGSPAGAVSLTPATVDFGQVEVGTTSKALQVEAGNSSGTAVSITGVAVTTPFKIASNSCGTSSLAANTDCQVMVDFAPTQTGLVTGTLTFTDGAGTQTVTLTGTGAAPPTDALSPVALSFPGTVIGQNSTAQRVTITNTGDLPLTSIAATVSGAFQVSSNCGTQLVAQSVCTLSVVFTPTQAGAQTGTLTVSDLLRTQTVALSGTGLLPPAFTATPASLSFAAQQVGVTSSPQTLTVTNSGGAAMADVGFQLTGSAAASYALGTNTCGAALNSGSSCTVQVIFAPAASGGSAATLVLSSSTLGVTPLSVPLNGNGTVTTGLSVSPTKLTYSTTLTGFSSAAQTVTVSNTGSFAATALTLTTAAPFSLTQNTCTSSLAAGASCTVGVVFTPTASGTTTGTLAVASDSVPVPASVALSGVGAVQFDFTVTASGATSQTVVSGKAASYTLVITPLNGLQGTFTFQCGTLPVNALCLFNPTSETLSAGVAGNVTAQISTGQSGSSARLTDPVGWRVVPLLCGLVLLPFGWKRRRSLWLLAALLAILAGGASSCSGSGGGVSTGTGGSSGSGATPAGTYTIPITVSSNSVQRSITVTLVVD
ncbi:MAG: choice-of-anchor D domain-containing protein [Terracidiphilus sp.]|nr:choice-of-anchor D domain-containing protein [Terracidiphilus sp.]MDR3776085.1 choice-of-anchor D domain-containing protein [Terracidiphilus sp.]